MLTNISTGVARLIRKTVINHPNALECQLFRQRPVRPASSTMGGARVLSSEDEHDVELVHVGNGYALPAQNYAGGSLFDAMDAGFEDGAEFGFLIEPEEEQYFAPSKQDLLYIVISDDVKLAYEIVGVTSPMQMTPHPRIWMASRSGDRDLIQSET